VHFPAHAEALTGPATVIALDGKTLRGSLDFGLNLLRHNGQANIRPALYDNALNSDRVLS
jgi:hypothetical protein